MRHATAQRAQRGYTLVFVMIVLAAVSAFIIAGANYRRARVVQADTRHLSLAADTLAQSGLEAALGAHRTGAGLKKPLNIALRMGTVRGDVVVTQAASDVRSCARVVSGRRTQAYCLSAQLKQTKGLWTLGPAAPVAAAQQSPEGD